MTDEEKSIWQATYAAMFVRLMDERTDRYSKCVDAIYTADEAVRLLRDRRKTGAPNAGKKVID